MEINYRKWLHSGARECARARERTPPPPRALQVLPACCATCDEGKKNRRRPNGSRMTRGDRRVKRKARARRLADTLLWALGVEGQGDMAQILDVEGGGLG